MAKNAAFIFDDTINSLVGRGIENVSYVHKDEVFDVVQPDLSEICDKNKLDTNGCAGSPDLIIEILSPSSAKLDKMEKRNLYEKALVEEYWIVDPHNELIEVNNLDRSNLYGKPAFFSVEDTIESILIIGLEINAKEIL